MQKTNLLKQLLEKKSAVQKARNAGILENRDLSKHFKVGEKPQPIIRRGGRNGSGKP
ncbi:MAG TPA: hypothetical protein PKC28_15840 [Bdellovibrionales bacterium]|nr:hypothetical protein [Bdellovibrionales bacterium]